MSTSLASVRSVPSLRLAQAPGPSALPAPLTTLVGREREVALAGALLRRPDVRLLTMTGPGGIGKTRLAIELARAEAAAFPDGVVFIPMAVVAGPDQVAEAIARALGVQASIAAAGPEGLAGALRDAVALLALDSFEHILDAAPLLTELLAGAPGIKIVVTSRLLLRLAGEFALPVPPLVLPDARQDQPLGDVSRTAAVQLFVDRARAISPGFALTDETAVPVGRICRHLDGLPLAIELVAAQAAVRPPAAFLAHIQTRMPLPIAVPRNALVPPRPITDAVAWSYDLLTSDEGRCLRWMSVFVGGFGLDAADAVVSRESRDVSGETGTTAHDSQLAAHDSRLTSLDVIASLVAKGLIQQQSWDGEARFVMLETIRAYAWNLLVSGGEEEAASDAHAAWVLSLVEPAELAVAVPGHERRLRRLEIEHPNVIAALTWLDRRGDMEGLLRLAAANGGIAPTNGRFREGRDWLERGLARAPAEPSPARGRAMVSLGRLVSLSNEVDRAEALLTDGIAAMDPKADALTVASAYIRLGAVANQRGQHDRAEHILDQALASVNDIQDPDFATTVAITVLGNLGVVAHGQGNLDLARTRYEQALAMSREHKHSFGVVRHLRDLGDVDRDRGDHVASLASYKQCLEVLDWLIEPRVLVDALEGSALAAAVWREPVKAARLLGAAEVQRGQYGGAFVVPSDAAAHQRTLSVIRSALSEAAIEDAWGAGRALSVPDAIAEVHALVPPGGRPPPAHTAERERPAR